MADKWQEAIAWTRRMCERKNAAFNRSWALAQTQARKAHPETNGEDLLVHNWGNEEAKRHWTRHRERSSRMFTACDAAYSRIWADARRSLQEA